MRILVISRVSIPAKDRTLPCWEYLRSLGHTAIVEHPDTLPSTEPPDVMISMGITVMDETFAAVSRFPYAPLYAYNWDVYAWVWEPGYEGKRQAYHEIRNQGQQREYDYVRYGELLKLAREVWVPSACTGRRTKQWYGLGNWAVIKSACPWWEYDCPDCGGYGRWADKISRDDPIDKAPICPRCSGSGSGVRDDGYALMCLREIPDPHWGLFERACEAEGIPYKTPKHELSYADYQDVVARCRFICAPLYELSTGGLSLLEAYYHGKPVLASDSEWNAAQEYFGKRALYFKDGDETELRRKLRLLWERPEAYVRKGYREWIEREYSDQRMVNDILTRIEVTR